MQYHTLLGFWAADGPLPGLHPHFFLSFITDSVFRHEIPIKAVFLFLRVYWYMFLFSLQFFGGAPSELSVASGEMLQFQSIWWKGGSRSNGDYINSTSCTLQQYCTGHSLTTSY